MRSPGRFRRPAAVLAGSLAAAAVVLAAAVAPVPAQRAEPALGPPLREPPSLRSHGGLLETTLTAAPGTATVGGRTFRGLLYNGRYIPPTLRVRPGDRLRIHLRNRIPQQTNLHTHGFNVPAIGHSDNVLIDVASGTDYLWETRLPRDHRPGLYWYHPHAHPDVEHQVFGGLSGAIVVEGLLRHLPSLAGIRQHIMLLKDVQVTAAGTIPTNIDSDAPTTRTVNGQVNPTVAVRPGETQLWRIGNIGADIWYRLRLEGQPFVQIAQDGNPLPRPWRRREIILPPGKRAEVLIRGLQPGRYRLRTLRYDQGPQGDTYPERVLATMVVRGALATTRRTPARVAPFEDLRRERVDRRRVLVFSENAAGTQFYIDGRQFDHHRTDQFVRLGALEEWTVRNVSGELHPFHIHQGDFQVIRVNGRPVVPHGVQDVVPLPVRGAVTFRMRFDQPGRFVYHCHILAHEDAGMMGIVLVSGPRS